MFSRRTIIKNLLIILFTAHFTASLFSQESRPPRERFSKAIEDNSFFIEEAYNQEKGVVQHISSMLYSFAPAKSCLYTFTQEWPLSGQDHQLSFTIPFDLFSSAHPGGIADILLNYRYQLSDVNNWAAIAPRLSIILPTGSVDAGLGTGVTGFQINVAASKRVSEALVVHLNAGITHLPNIQGESESALRGEHSITSYNVGGSIIWLKSEGYNLMLECVANLSVDAFDNGIADRSTEAVISPGFRYAINLKSLQVVPGIGIPLFLRQGGTRVGVFLYLSFEHPY